MHAQGKKCSCSSSSECCLHACTGFHCVVLLCELKSLRTWWTNCLCVWALYSVPEYLQPTLEHLLFWIMLIQWHNSDPGYQFWSLMALLCKWVFECTKMSWVCELPHLELEKAALLNGKILCLLLFPLFGGEPGASSSGSPKQDICVSPSPFCSLFYSVIPKQTYLSLPLFACFYYAFNSTMEAKKGCELMYWPFTLKDLDSNSFKSSWVEIILAVFSILMESCPRLKAITNLGKFGNLSLRKWST